MASKQPTRLRQILLFGEELGALLSTDLHPLTTAPHLDGESHTGIWEFDVKDRISLEMPLLLVPKPS